MVASVMSGQVDACVHQDLAAQTVEQVTLLYLGRRLRITMCLYHGYHRHLWEIIFIISTYCLDIIPGDN